MQLGGPLPLYYQLTQHVLQRIRNAEFPVGSALPTEEQLCTEYGISRSTVRQAMTDLLSRGVIVRRRGLGTFVAESGDLQKVVRLVSSVHEALQYIRGLEYRDSIYQEITAPPDIAKWLHIEAGSQIVLQCGVGCIEGEPISNVKFFYPIDIGRKMDSKVLQDRALVLATLEARLGQRVTRAEKLIEADVADPQCAAALGIAVSRPLLRSTRVFSLADARPVMAVIAHYHPDRYKLHVELIEQTPR
jgi:GntR family transcriptional regulator